MQAMQRLVNVPEVAATMREMSKEMMKAGIMEEMIEETMESIEPDMEDMEEQAQEEIDKVCLLFFSVLRQGWHILSASQWAIGMITFELTFFLKRFVRGYL